MSYLVAQIASTTKIKLPSIAYSAIAPELIMIIGALAVILISALVVKHLSRVVSIGFGVLIGALSLGYSIYLGFSSGTAGANKGVLSGAIASDKFAIFFYGLFSVVAILTIALGKDLMRLDRRRMPEFVALVLLSTSGAMFMASALDLIVIFLGLEILSLALYVLVAIEPGNSASRESSIKYFMLGGFSSAIFLYGVALIYGATGTTNIGQISNFLANNLLGSSGILLAGIGLVLVGLGFKISAVPFHFWAPDVYQGAPSPVTGFMAATAKAAGFAALLRVFMSGLASYSSDWIPVIGVLSVLTLIVGAILAVVQRDVKRTLAYSSINQAGFILLGLYAASSRGVGASLYYLAIYSVVIVGAFATVGAIERLLGKERISLDDLRGLSRRSPFLAFCFVLLVLAQAGAPFTTGFLAKFNEIIAITSARHYPVAIIAMLSAAIAVFFYLRMALLAYRPSQEMTSDGAEVLISLEDEDDAYQSGTDLMVKSRPAVETKLRVDVSTVVIALSVAFTVGLGIIASPMIDLANRAVLFFK